jgi:hypothetical protein
MGNAIPTILVLGAAGQFGTRLCDRIAQLPEVRLLLAGRDGAKLATLQQTLPPDRSNTVTLDVTAPNFAVTLRALKPNLVLHLAGPFQGQDYAVAQACIAAGAAYIDMADGRDFVQNFSSLNLAAQQAGVSLVTGVSTVPAFSAAIIDAFIPRFAKLETLDYGISAGLKTGLGRATLEAVLRYCGKPYPILHHGQLHQTYGLSQPRTHDYPLPVGRRALVDCEIPDLTLFPSRYPTLQTMAFGSCIDAPGLSPLLGSMSWLVAHGCLRDWNFLAAAILPFMRMMKIFGSRASGFFMALTGIGSDGKQLRILFELVAHDGYGLQIPITPVMVLVKRWLSGAGLPPGAYPCLDLMTLRDCATELAAYPITWYIDRQPQQRNELP